MTIYLDYQATTPLAPEVRHAMLPWVTDKFANPHSPHKPGREAAAAVEVAREALLAQLPSGGRLFFTSGATEALNWALRCSGTGGIALADFEHAATRDTAHWLASKGRALHSLALRADGLIDGSQPIPSSVGMVAAMLVNNEIGTKQPIAALAAQARAAGALMLCDAVQGFGKLAIPQGPDLIALSAHKIHGPKGIGALWVRNGVDIEPFMLGGGQEGGLRSGTLSPALCVGFGVAATLAARHREEDAAHVSQLWTAARAMFPAAWQLNGSAEQRYKGNLNIRLPGLDAARLVSEVREVAFSVGSACASGSGRPSHVLRAIGLSDAEARSSIRLGFGRYTSLPDLREAIRMILAAAANQSKLAA